MAAAEESHNLQPPTPPASSLPHYPEMIHAAIEALNDKNGSNKSAISNYIESTYGDLPAAHTTLLSHHLNKMRVGNELVLVKNNYMKPDPDAPPKRGRGRPPKPKTDSVPAVSTVVSPPRPRGRPPKPRDPFAPPAPPKPKKSSSGTGSGKPRGRPPKKAKISPSPSAPAPSPAAVAAAAAAPTPPAAPATVPTSNAPRGRGRPPKVKAPVAPVGA